MTNRCFSSSLLYTLRNEISVRMLIEKNLSIPCRVTNGCFRFLCPLCNGFDTAVNPKTNLARCFQCEKNFNTIDLVMLVRSAQFVDSVKFLQSIYKKKPARRPCQIDQIIGNILPLEHDDKQDKPVEAHQLTDKDRMEKLERQLELLSGQIEKIVQMLNQGLSSK
jgi:hypothetical protein